jgi:hypothetical protein
MQDFFLINAEHTVGCRWLVEIRRIMGRSQPRAIVCETLSQKNASPKRAGGVAQGVGPEFKPQY